MSILGPVKCTLVLTKNRVGFQHAAGSPSVRLIRGWAPAKLIGRGVDSNRKTLDYTEEEIVKEYVVDDKNSPTPKRKKKQSPHLPDPDMVLLLPGYSIDRLNLHANEMALPRVKEILDYASAKMRMDMTEICCGEFEKMPLGIQEPAKLVISMLNYLLLWKERLEMSEKNFRVAGLGVGELVALVASGWLQFQAAFDLAIARGNSLEDASLKTQSRLLVVKQKKSSQLTSALEHAKQFCTYNKLAETPVCSVAQYLYAECKVIGGHEPAIQFIAHNRDYFNLGNCRYISYPVASNTSIVHTSGMKRAAEKLPEVIENNKSDVVAFSSLSGRPLLNWIDVKKTIIGHCTNAVKWEQVMYSIYKRQNEGTACTGICGDNKELTDLLRLGNRGVYNCFVYNRYQSKHCNGQ